MPELTKSQEAELDNLFSYHKPFGNQPERYEQIRKGGKLFAEIVLTLTPKCADQWAALRLIREAVMTANAAIAVNEVDQTRPAQPGSVVS